MSNVNVVQPNEVVPMGENDRVVYVGPGVAPVVLLELAAPTPAEEIKQRTQAGKTLDYIDARFVMERLDTVLGPENWQDQFQDTYQGTRCMIGVLVAGVGWVWKGDAGTPSTIEPVKGSHSDAFKRAAVKWGIARDLYEDREPAPQAAAPRQTVAQQAAPGANGRASRYAPVSEEEEAAIAARVGVAPEEMAWLCPIHNTAKIVPAGVSKKTRRPYPAFYACTEYNCNEKGPRVEDEN